ncbi:hypothetical protein [aff. Roholtiella sp. LEGE 12411]|uniref:hypothetical protein n=1 Tax=aff. Roholtiella sp. LEGE 12411 TaxID=1828822 RepID=UPI00187FF36A|nr:hypothetical protein [aff. Roholtiella sp. LEGE 12411]MBE9038827.1 hypothetical protein [aff. Roholtiella sp. LEGE 12411]
MIIRTYATGTQGFWYKSQGSRMNGTKKSLKAYVASFPVFRLGMYSERAAASRQATGGGASLTG